MRKVYIGLLSRGKEVNARSYERICLGCTAWVLGVVDGVLQLQNTRHIKFGPARQDWGFITDFGLYGRKKGGPNLKRIPLVKIEFVGKGDSARIEPGDLELDVGED